MPLQWTVSHRLRLVVAVAKGDVRPRDLIDFLARLDDERARPYGKIFGVTDLVTVFSEDDIHNLAALVRRRESESLVGPLAIVATEDRCHRQAELFAEIGRLVRPIAVFREWHLARRWVESEQARQADQDSRAVA
ncbi:hypothetical protein [Reyranella sp.]|uniref:hypothetical protein n=1 Tax=Reyranella sp. TaxID=1929291 RepID=UPI003BA8CFBA